MDRDSGSVATGAAVRGPLMVRVPAKINLFLAVRGLRDDGMHEVVTVLQTVDIHDRLVGDVRGPLSSLQHPAARKLMDVTLQRDLPAGLPGGEENLVMRAARRLLDRFGHLDHDSDLTAAAPVTHLHLHKRIPVAAGMGGGSADAAATLVLLNELWGLRLSNAELRCIAAELGADVPFCIGGGTALGTGTGTAVAPMLCRGSFHWVVCVDDRPLPTAEVYRTWDRVGEPGPGSYDEIFEALSSGDAEALGPALRNDLEVAAFHLRPDLRDLADRLWDRGALGVVVSGSGPTLLALARSEHHARALARQVAPFTPRVEVARSPAGGPRIERAGRGGGG